MEEKKYSLLSVDTFHRTFKDSLNLGEKNDFRFITKAYYQTDNVVSVYEDENTVDCYFQLPNYKDKLVPHERRFIYLLPKGKLQEFSKTNAPDGRFSIEVSKLIKVADPYADEENKLLIKESVKVTDSNNANGSTEEDIYLKLKKLNKYQLGSLITAATAELLTR